MLFGDLAMDNGCLFFLSFTTDQCSVQQGCIIDSECLATLTGSGFRGGSPREQSRNKNAQLRIKKSKNVTNQAKNAKVAIRCETIAHISNAARSPGTTVQQVVHSSGSTPALPSALLAIARRSRFDRQSRLQQAEGDGDRKVKQGRQHHGGQRQRQ